jgi:NDP-sugar pyrophosphorylase family protein
MSLLDSVAGQPVQTDGYTAIGDGVIVGRGVRLSGAIIQPGLTVARGNEHEKE